MLLATRRRLLLFLLPRHAAAAPGAHRDASSSSPPIQTPTPHSSPSPHCAPIPNPKPDLPSPTASYLVASCGLSTDAALRASRSLTIQSTPKADAVLALLRSYGFSAAHISRIARSRPQLLTLDPDKILKAKLDFFVGLGFAGPSLHKLLTRSPTLLSRSLEKHLVPGLDFLRGILRTDAGIVAAISTAPRALLADVDKVMRPALEALRRHGMPEEAIFRLVLSQMHVLTLTPDRIGEIFEDLRAAGLQLNDEKRFVRCFYVLCNFNRSSWERKIAFYKSFGISESEVLKAFRTQPSIASLSDEKIERKLRFFVDTLKLDLADIIACPLVLAVSLENTTLPRCAVLSVLMREGRIGQNINLLTPLISSAKVFFEKYVSKYQHEVPDVQKAYEGNIEFRGF